MRIVDAALFTYDLTYSHGTYVMSHGREITELPAQVVRLTTDDGLVGWGEICALGPAYLPVTAEGLSGALAELLPLLLGRDPLDRARIRAHLDDRMLGQGYAKSPVDIALWDLAGQAAGQPVHSLLGGRVVDDVPCYWAVPLAAPDAMVDFIRARRAEGCTHFQLKLGDEPDADVERLHAISEALEPGDFVSADANCGWTVPQAIKVVRQLPDDPRIVVEQPCATTAECLDVARYLPGPIILDETIHTVRDLVDAAASGSVCGVNLKTGRVGGLTNQVLLKNVANALGLSVSIEDMWGGDITTAAIAHVACTIPAERLMLTPQSNAWNLEHVAADPIDAPGCRMAPPDAPGLGVHPEADRLGEPLLHVTA